MARLISFLILAAFVAVASSHRVAHVFCPRGFTAAANYAATQRDDSRLVALINYITGGVPEHSTFLSSDKQFAGVFNKANNLLIAVLAANPKGFEAGFAGREQLKLYSTEGYVEMHHRYDQIVQHSVVASVVLPEDLIASEKKLLSESVESISKLVKEGAFGEASVEGNILTIKGEKFDLTVPEQSALFIELAFLVNFPKATPARSNFLVISAPKTLAKTYGVESTLYKTANLIIEEVLPKLVSNIETSSHVAVEVVVSSETQDEKRSITSVAGTMASSNSSSSSSTPSNGTTIYITSANYTGLAWISIFASVGIAVLVAFGAYLMVGVGEDCANDTLLYRSTTTF